MIQKDLGECACDASLMPLDLFYPVSLQRWGTVLTDSWDFQSSGPLSIASCSKLYWLHRYHTEKQTVANDKHRDLTSNASEMDTPYK